PRLPLALPDALPIWTARARSGTRLAATDRVCSGGSGHRWSYPVGMKQPVLGGHAARTLMIELARHPGPTSGLLVGAAAGNAALTDRKSTRLNSSHVK